MRTAVTQTTNSVRNDASIVWTAMRSRFFIHPVFFFPDRPVSARDLANRAGLILRAGFRAIAECFLPVALLLGIPLVNSHFHSHPAAPDAAVAEVLVGAGV